MNLRSKILKKLGIEKEFRIDLGDKIVVAKCNVAELLATKDPDKACEIIAVIEKNPTNNKQNNGESNGDSHE